MILELQPKISTFIKSMIKLFSRDSNNPWHYTFFFVKKFMLKSDYSKNNLKLTEPQNLNVIGWTNFRIFQGLQERVIVS